MIRTLFRNKDGASVIEFAFALPILVTMMWGIFQFGALFGSDAGMQHALGEGARMVTIWPTPTDSEIKTKMTDKLFKTGWGTFTIADPQRDAANGYIDLRITYRFTPNLLFYRLPQVTLTRTKRAYIST